MKELFDLGQCLITPGAQSAIEKSGDDPLSFLTRHIAGDWGDLGKHDIAVNDNAVAVGSRIFSAYHLKDDTKIWVITEADRSSTTVLLPSEY